MNTYACTMCNLMVSLLSAIYAARDRSAFQCFSPKLLANLLHSLYAYAMCGCEHRAMYPACPRICLYGSFAVLAFSSSLLGQSCIDSRISRIGTCSAFGSSYASARFTISSTNCVLCNTNLSLSRSICIPKYLLACGSMPSLPRSSIPKLALISVLKRSHAAFDPVYPISST